MSITMKVASGVLAATLVGGGGGGGGGAAPETATGDTDLDPGTIALCNAGRQRGRRHLG
ncbi:hypothetical protein [Subtercola boreus]|uniref:hypothetical protein n=1 Tax=Subtercola boreus TaxID=120213 RepID=UPI001558D265|nr:hypothetical protein [Subtercola boreus]